MKNSIFIAGVALTILALPAAAHPGRTDANGCHTNQQTGEYHCHNSGSGNRPSNLTSAQVISVGDGDTVRAAINGRTVTIRMACIDAPETAQTPWGQQSGDRLRALLPKGQAISVRAVEQDRYGRTVGEVFKGNTSINLQMVKEGKAVVYRQYLSACQATQNQYLAAEAQAKQKRSGYWNQANPVMPWDFRRSQR